MNCYNRDCTPATIGTYTHQITVVAPWGAQVTVDACMVPELAALWRRGIRTVASCCGHKASPGFVAADPDHAHRLDQLGYERCADAPHCHVARTSAPAAQGEAAAPAGFRVGRGGQWIGALPAYDAEIVAAHRAAGATVELLYATPQPSAPGVDSAINEALSSAPNGQAGESTDYCRGWRNALEYVQMLRSGPQPSADDAPTSVVREVGDWGDCRGNGPEPALHPRTADLVRRFAAAMAAKLLAAQIKYGYSDGWADSDWHDECRAKLLEHVDKGDPRDVANYCAFLWHHGASTAQPSGRPSTWPGKFGDALFHLDRIAQAAGVGQSEWMTPDQAADLIIAKLSAATAQPSADDAPRSSGNTKPCELLGMSDVDYIANDGRRNAAGGIYATSVQEFAREIQIAFAQQNSIQIQGVPETAPAPPADARDAELAALRAFANDVIAEHLQFDPDIQELAEQHGLLAQVTVTESCGDNCECAEVGFPAECYRKTSILLPADRAIAGASACNELLPAWPECSGDPACCPENEGYGCCKPNPAGGAA